MMEAYYTWREVEATLNGQTVRWMGKPGLEHWDTLDPGAQLLIEGALPAAGQSLVDLRCGAGLAAALAIQRGAQATLCDDSLVAVEAARRTLALCGVRAASVTHGIAGLPRAAFDVAWLNAPRGREWVGCLLAQAASALKPGGALYLVGPNRGGIKSYLEDVSRSGGEVQVLRIKRRCRLAVCTFRQSARPGLEGEMFRQGSAVCRGQAWRYVSAPGVFGALDEGTRVLMEAMQIQPGDTALDLGCGCGIVGLAAARLGARVYCVDHSAVAVEAARRTMALNGVSDAVVLPSDCADAVRQVRFDVVAANPPFHQGVGVEYSVARQFIRDAADVLKPGGALYLVANRFIRYDSWLSELFAAAATVYEDGRFRVMRATR